MSSMNNDLLERYRAARTLTNTINKSEETLYHKRQRITLENLRTDAYKHTLIQTKRREWSRYQHHTTHRSIRLSTNIRRTFQVDKQESSNNISPRIIINTLPPRIYPATLNIRQVLSNQSMNVTILQETCFLGQFDRKFLISKRHIHSSDINRIQLILFDQHAISERIILEQLQTYFQKQHIRIIPFQLPSPAVITRNPRFLYTPEQISLLEHTGFIFSSISTHNLFIRAVPNWLLSLNQRQSATSLLDDIISHTIDNILRQTNSQSNNIELIIYETLKSLACHNAIKFNDILSTNECQHLLNELKSCSMPFICAHGRTSASILWEYDIISEENYQVDMNELEQIASIHKWLKES